MNLEKFIYKLCICKGISVDEVYNMKKTLTLSIEETLIEKIKIKAIKDKKDVSELFEEWVKGLK